MKKENFDLFDNILGCYFNQDFDLICGNIDNAIRKIFSNYDTDELIILINQINEIIQLAKDEKNLESILYEIFHIEVTPKVGGDNMNTYTELLEYIRDHIKKYLESQKIKIT